MVDQICIPVAAGSEKCLLFGERSEPKMKRGVRAGADPAQELTVASTSAKRESGMGRRS